MTKRRKARVQNGPWSKEEVKKLKAMFRRMSTAEVASALGRTVGSVSAKAYSLDLHKTKKHLRSIGKG
jgi:hypothetical protein